MGNSTQTTDAPFNHNDDVEVYDIFSIGFGPAALALAIALNEHPNAKNLNAHFIELQPEFGWHKGMLIPGYRMQVSFLKDLATLRDPTSAFTFLNYMHKTGRLVDFFNLYTFLPLRTEWNDYMAWCAGHFKHQVSYSTVGLNVEPYFPPGSDHPSIDILKVTYKNVKTGELGYALTRNLVIATGAQPKMPDIYPRDHPRIQHSSQYLSTTIPKDVKRIAIVGAGQSAAEIFKDISTRYPEVDTRLFFRASALRSAETTGFVNELYNPKAVDRFFNLAEKQRIDLLEEIRCTNYSVVHEIPLKDLFQLRYIDDATGKRGKHALIPNTDIVKVVPTSSSIKLTIKDLITNDDATEEFDFLFVGVGYQRSAQIDLLKSHFSDALFPLSVRRDYSVSSRDPNFKAGIYLQGMTEGSHGMSDSVISVMSVRGMEVVESILRRKEGVDWSLDEKVNKVQVTSRADGLVWGI